jgi:hypothetical protein
MKQIGKLVLLGAVLVAAAPFASAPTVNGSFWSYPSSTIVPCTPAVNGVCTGNQGAIPSVIPGSPTVTFTVSASSGNLFDFYLSGASNDNSLLSFLTNGYTGPNGDTVSSLGANGALNINDGLFMFTGVTTLTAGQVLSITDDDGVILFLNGVKVIDEGQPQSDNPTAPSWTYVVSPALAGTDTFTLYYAETNGAPAQLKADLGLAPEPNSLMLLGTGLISGAGMLWRKRTAA